MTIKYNPKEAKRYIDNPKEHSLISNGGIYLKYTPIYTYTTENIRDYMPLFTFTNKDVLTVCGSGDQALNAILYDPKSISVFDINIASLLFLYLKKAFIQRLTKEEYINCINNKFPKEYYLVVRELLDTNTRRFWDQLYNMYNNLDAFTFLNNLSKKVLLDRNEYIESSNYQELQNKLKKIKIKTIRCDLKYLNSYIKHHYDLILLSNIFDHLNTLQKISLNEFKTILETKVIPLLNKEGQILCAYLYHLNYVTPISIMDLENTFNSDEYKINTLKCKDYVLSYKRNE